MKRFINPYKLLWIINIISIVGISYAQNEKQVKNVVVILSDDHALPVIGTYGNKIINTPSIDKLAAEGITFTRAYGNSPICSASRQSLLTGKYPHATGVNLLFTPFPDEGNTTIAEHLKGFGYRSALIGKSHFNNWVWYPLYKDGLPNHGFDQLIQANDYREYLKTQNLPTLTADIEYYESSKAKISIAEQMNWRCLPQPVFDEFSQGTYYANQAIEFMKENKEDPFFLWVAFHEPHQPFYFPIEYADKYDPNEMPLPEGSPEDDRWIPQIFKDLSKEEKRGIIASYYTSVEYMDKNIGLVLKAINDLDLDKNTLVIYISDNGYLLYDHKRFEKHTMWEESVKLPLIIRNDDEIIAGSTSTSIVEYIDIVPTILDIIGVDPLNEVQGVSFKKCLKDLNNPHKEFAFAEYLEDNLAMIVTNEWKYMFTSGSRDLGIGYQTGLGPSGIVHRLYNLVNDPSETTDVSKKPANAEVLIKLQNMRLNRFMETHPDAKNCPGGLTLEGKLVWFCEPRDIGTNQSILDKPERVFYSD